MGCIRLQVTIWRTLYQRRIHWGFHRSRCARYGQSGSVQNAKGVPWRVAMEPLFGLYCIKGNLHCLLHCIGYRFIWAADAYKTVPDALEGGHAPPCSAPQYMGYYLSHSYANLGPPPNCIRPQYTNPSRTSMCCMTLFSSCVSTLMALICFDRHSSLIK